MGVRGCGRGGGGCAGGLGEVHVDGLAQTALMELCSRRTSGTSLDTKAPRGEELHHLRERASIATHRGRVDAFPPEPTQRFRTGFGEEARVCESKATRIRRIERECEKERIHGRLRRCWRGQGGWQRHHS